MINDGVDWVALSIVVLLFLAAAAVGFAAREWRRGRHAAATRHTLDEWGLGGRGFGPVTTWFLLGGDVYTAYTFIAVPAAMYAGGAVSGFFAVPYTILVYPLVFLLMPRLWSVARRHGYVTPADFVRGRYDSGPLALAVAVTGILATLPYIALQLIGIQAVLEVIGVGGDSLIARDLPLFVAFGVLAAFTSFSGLRGPALISFVKGTLLWVVVALAVAYLPYRLGGMDSVFSAAKESLAPRGAFVPGPDGFLSYTTLALGSAMALFMYPHTVTAVLAARSRDVVRRSVALLPAFSLLLGLFALFGFMALAAGTEPVGLDGQTNPQLVVPRLFADLFPSWFAGIVFGAVAIGALVPAAIMSIAVANLFARNIYREYVNPDAEPEDEARVSRTTSLLVKFGALAVVLFLDRRFALDFQLLGGIWILQTFPAIAFGLFTRWFHPIALLAGWGGGMTFGTLAAYDVVNPATGRHFGGVLAEVPFLGEGHTAYIALLAFALNALIAVVFTLVLRALRTPGHGDRTSPADYRADDGDTYVPPMRELIH
jgi:SSS family solute:Na+ symporter